MRRVVAWAVLLVGTACARPAPPVAEPPTTVAAASADVVASEAYAYATTDTLAAEVYVTLVNPGAEPDSLVSVLTCSSRWAHAADGAGRPAALLVGAHDSIALRPSARHIRIGGLARKLLDGDVLTLAMTFKRSGVVVVPVSVVDRSSVAAS